MKYSAGKQESVKTREKYNRTFVSEILPWQEYRQDHSNSLDERWVQL